jgi:hypothetical protein
MRVAALGCLFLAVAGCSVAADTKATEQQVAVFHDRLNAGSVDEIYNDSSPAFKRSSDAAEFKKLMVAIHRKLGRATSEKQTGWRVNATTAGTFVNLVYDSTFERGPATETFTYLVTGGARPVLNGYNISSVAMMTN